MPQAGSTQVRTRVLDAARGLLARDLGPMSMSAVAAAAGVSRATLYREFRGREALERALRLEAGGAPAWPERTMRARILEGARRAIAEHGVFNVTVEHVARAAGVGEATIYRTFGEREALLRAAFDEIPARQAALTLLTDDAAPLRPTLTALAKALLSFAAEPELLRLLAFGHDSEARYVRRLRTGQRSALAQLARYLTAQQMRGRLRECPPAQLSGALLGAVYAAGLALRAADGASGEPDDAVLERRAREVVDIFLDGAARGGRRGGDRE